jgi:hypothetical protein
MQLHKINSTVAFTYLGPVPSPPLKLPEHSEHPAFSPTLSPLVFFFGSGLFDTKLHILVWIDPQFSNKPRQ